MADSLTATGAYIIGNFVDERECVEGIYYRLNVWAANIGSEVDFVLRPFDPNEAVRLAPDNQHLLIYEQDYCSPVGKRCQSVTAIPLPMNITETLVKLSVDQYDDVPYVTYDVRDAKSNVRTLWLSSDTIRTLYYNNETRPAKPEELIPVDLW